MAAQRADNAAPELRSQEAVLCGPSVALLTELIGGQAHEQARAALEAAVARATVEETQQLLLDLIDAMRAFCLAADLHDCGPIRWVAYLRRACVDLQIYERNVRGMDPAGYLMSPEGFWEKVDGCIRLILDVERDGELTESLLGYPPDVQRQVRVLLAASAANQARRVIDEPPLS